MARKACPWFREAKGAWYVKLNGRQVPLGVSGRENRAEAIQAWHRVMSGSLAGPTTATPTLSVPPAFLEPESILVRDWQTAFISSAESRVRATTLVWYRHALERFAGDFANRQLGSVSTTDVEKWILRQSSWGATSRAHAIRIIRIAFRWGVRCGWIDKNPLDHVTVPPSRSRGESAVITATDHSKMLAAATPQFRVVLEVLHATGARPAEVASFTADTFDSVNGLVRLHQHKTSHLGKHRTIYLTPKATELLQGQLHQFPTGALLRNRLGNPWTKDAIVLAMRRVRRKSGVKATAYSYRHTFATDALANGVPEAHVAELLGHSSTAMLHRHYSHLGTKARVLADAVRKVR